MFQALSIIGILAALGLGALHFVLIGRKVRRFAGRPAEVRRYSLWSRLVHLAVTVGFLVLAFTGFLPALQGEHLRGWLLVIHCVAAPVFAVGLAAMVVTWAASCRFEKHDWQWLRRGGQFFGTAEDLPAGRYDAGQKVLLWVFALLGLLLILSMALSMLSLFGQEGLDFLLWVHQYSALVLVMGGILHAYFAVVAKPGTWRSLVSGKVSDEWARCFHPLWRLDMRQEERQ